MLTLARILGYLERRPLTSDPMLDEIMRSALRGQVAGAAPQPGAWMRLQARIQQEDAGAGWTRAAGPAAWPRPPMNAWLALPGIPRFGAAPVWY